MMWMWWNGIKSCGKNMELERGGCRWRHRRLSGGKVSADAAARATPWIQLEITQFFCLPFPPRFLQIWTAGWEHRHDLLLASITDRVAVFPPTNEKTPASWMHASGCCYCCCCCCCCCCCWLVTSPVLEIRMKRVGRPQAAGNCDVATLPIANLPARWRWDSISVARINGYQW